MPVVQEDITFIGTTPLCTYFAGYYCNGNERFLVAQASPESNTFIMPICKIGQ